MIIICPSCSTQYSIGREILGERGKTVRCSHCGYQWMQVADAASAPLRRLARAASMAGAERPQPQAEAMAAMVAEALERPQPAPEPEPLPEPESEPEPEPEPEPVPEPMEEPDLVEPASEAPEEASLSDEDIERILNANPEPEPEVVQSLVDGEQEEQEPINPEDIPDPEPIPEVFTATDRMDADEPDSGHKGLWVAVIAFVVLVVLGAGLYLWRMNVMALWPISEPLYAMVGVEKLGAGLQLVDLRNEWANEADLNDLVVHGVIANNSDRERSVPMLRIELRDERNEIVQVYVYPPEKTNLASGEKLTFKAHVGEVLKTARRTHVLWTDELPPDTGKGPDTPAG
jgi:predicted Zn finger-like uncharacterized protein